MLSPWLKLATGVAATALVANGAWRWEGQEITTRLARRSANVMLRHGINDGSVSFLNDRGWMTRTARLSGTADPAARASVAEDLAQKPGIHAVLWCDQ
jgi:hypothetical protein